MSNSLASSQRIATPNLKRLLLLLLAVLAIALVLRLNRKDSPPIVVPSAGTNLDGQVKAYLLTLVAIAKSAPSDPKARAELGLAYAANGLWTEARQIFLDTATLAPHEPLAPLYAAVSLQELADEAGAWREFCQVSSNFPNFAPAWYRVGEAALRRGDFEPAEAAFRRLVQLAPGEWRGPAGLGEIRFRQGNFLEALGFLETSVKIDFHARPAQYLLGQVYRSLGRTNEARLALALGSAESRLPMPDAWNEDAPRHMRLLPDQLAQADELSQRGEPDRAIRLLRQALVYHPNHSALLNQLAVALNRAGQPDEAIQFANRAIDADTNSVAVLVTRALIQAHRGQFQAGILDARRALQLAPGLTQAHLALAEIWLAQEQDREAIAALQDAAKSDPHNAEVLAEMGDIYWHNLGEKGTAMTHYQKSIELNPALVRARGHLGLLQLETGDAPGARQSLMDLVRIAPDSVERRDLEAALTSR